MVANWVTVLHGPDHLDFMVHTWTLAVEEHFYLVWPIVVAWLPARYRWRGIVWLLALGAAWRGFLYVTGATLELAYGTDGNAASLLAGCALAVSRERWRPDKRAGLLALFGLLALATAPGLPGRFLAIALAVIAVQTAPSVNVLRASWLRWFGLISYGLYLWHPPLMALVDSRWLMIPVAVGMAWCSWALLERPILEATKGARNEIPDMDSERADRSVPALRRVGL